MYVPLKLINRKGGPIRGPLLTHVPPGQTYIPPDFFPEPRPHFWPDFWPDIKPNLWQGLRLMARRRTRLVRNCIQQVLAEFWPDLCKIAGASFPVGSRLRTQEREIFPGGSKFEVLERNFPEGSRLESWIFVFPKGSKFGLSATKISHRGFEIKNKFTQWVRKPHPNPQFSPGGFEVWALNSVPYN